MESAAHISTQNSACLSPNSITPTLQQSPQLCCVHKSWKSATKIMTSTFMICVTDFRDLCPRESPQTLLQTFLVHCNRLNSIRATQMGLLRTCHGLCRKHLDMSKWFVSTTVVIFVGYFHRNFMISWFVTVCVRDFPDLCPWLSPQGSFGESWRNGTVGIMIAVIYYVPHYKTQCHKILMPPVENDMQW